MANIVNTPIVMSVYEHNLSLHDSSVTELMEYNTYPIKIYTDENLDGCQLVKRLQNDQQLVSVGDLKRDIRALLRSPINDGQNLVVEKELQKIYYFYDTQNKKDKFYKDSTRTEEITPDEKYYYFDNEKNKYYKSNYEEVVFNENCHKIEEKQGKQFFVAFENKAWWATIENLNDENNDYLYGGTLKVYQYENTLSAIPEISLRTQCEIVELGTIKLKLKTSTSGKEIIYKVDEVIVNPTTELEREFQISEEILKTSIITEDFLDIPSPLSEQYSIQTPEKVIIENDLKIGGPVHSFNLLDSNNEILNILTLEKNFELPFYFYDEEEGFYYYKLKIPKKVLSGSTKTNTDQALEGSVEEKLDVDFDVELVCKVPEENFEDYYLNLEASFEPKLTRSLFTEENRQINIDQLTLTRENFNYSENKKSLILNELSIPTNLFPETGLEKSLTIFPLKNLEFKNIELFEEDLKETIDGKNYFIFSNIINKDFLEYNKKIELEVLEIKDKVFNANLEITFKILEEDYEGLNNLVTDTITPIQTFNIQLKEIYTPYLALEEEHINYTYDSRENLVLNWGEIKFDEGSFDLDKVTINDDEGTHTKVYTLYDNDNNKLIEFNSDKYNGAGLNSLLFGIRKVSKDDNGREKIDYITNSVSLEIIPSIESDVWYTPLIEAKRAYLGIPVYKEKESNDEIETIIDFKNSNDELYNKEIDSIYINIRHYSLLESSSENDKTLENLEIYSWNPAESKFQKYESFLTPDKAPDKTPETSTEN